MFKELLGEFTIFGSAFAIMVALLPIIKLVHHITSSNRTFRVQALDLIFKSYADKSNISQRLVIEQMFESNFRMKVNYEIIYLFLTRKNPTEAISLYQGSKKYIDFGNHSINFKKKYQCKKRRKLEIFLKPLYNFILYVIFGTFGVMCVLFVLRNFSVEGLFLVEHLILNWALWFLLTILSIISIPFSISFLTDKSSILEATALMDIFSEKTKKVTSWHY